MALLTVNEIEAIRQPFVKNLGEANFTKPKINAAIQAVEDILAGATLQNSINTAINTATSPLVLTADQKRLLVRWILFSRYVRENV